MNLRADVRDPGLRDAVREAVARLGAQLLEDEHAKADVWVVEPAGDEALEAARVRAEEEHAALVVACHPASAFSIRLLAEADDWIRMPADPAELTRRIQAATVRASGARARDDLLYDRRSGLPTLPVMIERARTHLERRGELTVLYIHFVWYEKIEELYGWQKLDDVLETTAAAVRRSHVFTNGDSESIVMVSHVADDDFILFTHVPPAVEGTEPRLRAVADRLEAHLRESIEEVHGEDIAALCGVYVGAATVFGNPRFRTERLIYRGIREASQAARGAEQWERARRFDDLRATIREEAVFIEYHPIIVTRTEEVYGFEALARGVRRGLRSPEVMFDVAADANLVWELSRLLRRRAVTGILPELKPGQVLFLNVDPHDFDDPSFRNLEPADLGIDEPGRVVFEITERTAIRDYPRFREYIAAFRERGFRFAVDDAGSGYAGLGSIANLAPDYIKLDISLISNIDTNLLKQNLVATMVSVAERHGAHVVAEGVERKEEFEAVRSLGVHYTQGFLFHRPRFSGLPGSNE